MPPPPPRMPGRGPGRTPTPRPWLGSGSGPLLWLGLVPTAGALPAQDVQAFPGAMCPVGVGLVAQQNALIGQDAATSARHGPGPGPWQRSAERVLMGFQVDIDSGSRLGPNVPMSAWSSSAPDHRARTARLGPWTALSERARAAALAPRAEKSSSQARSRLTRRPGLTSTSSHRRLAVGRGQAGGPASYGDRERAEQLDRTASPAGGSLNPLQPRPDCLAFPAATPREQAPFT